MNYTLGLLLVVAAGALNGAFTMPMKKTKRWAFENTWLVYSIVAMGVMNWTIALVTVPNLLLVYENAGLLAIGMAFGFGMIWGLGNTFFGIGVHLVGISLTFPIVLGLSTALGSLIPMAAEPASFLTPTGMTTVIGVAVILAGVAVCAMAGLQRDAQAARDPDAGNPAKLKSDRQRLTKGLIIVTLSGLVDPFLNFAFHFGDGIKQQAVAQGAQVGAEADAIWVLTLTGSLVVNVVYCCVLLARNASWSRFRKSGTIHYWFLAALMAFFWMSSISLYGRGASQMGPMGSSIGWALFYCCIIIFSTMWGLVSGEWRNGKGRPLRTLSVGLAVLLLAIVILGYGNSLPSSYE